MLKVRVVTAILMLMLFIPALFYLPIELWASVMLVFTMVGLYEWAGLLQLKPVYLHSYMLASVLLGLCMLALLFAFGFHWFFYKAMLVFILATVFWCVCVPFALFHNRFISHAGFNLCLGWGLLFSLWMALVVAQTINPKFLLVVISTIWLADSAAYFFGKNFGKHKLAPAISPGKTWEGVAGALLAVAIYGALLKLGGSVSTWWILPCLWVITIVGVYGDLFESFFKRRANLKDSGHILPGHGGLLDRIDGVVPALPVALCLVFWFHYWHQSYSF